MAPLKKRKRLLHVRRLGFRVGLLWLQRLYCLDLTGVGIPEGFMHPRRGEKQAGVEQPSYGFNTCKTYKSEANPKTHSSLQPWRPAQDLRLPANGCAVALRNGAARPIGILGEKVQVSPSHGPLPRTHFQTSPTQLPTLLYCN